jgi:hypothetical protein
MRIEELDNSNSLEPGQLLAVLKCWRFCGNAAVYHLQQSVKSGLLQFYRHRREPVPGIRRLRNCRLFRRPKTTNERRAHFRNNATEESLESYGVAIKLRQKRSSHMLPHSWDDISRPHDRNWKRYRKRQRSNAGSIDRRIHSPPCWDWRNRVSTFE